MPLPKTISFAIEGKPVYMQHILERMTPEERAKAPTFGEEYAGTFELRWPTAGDRLRIQALTSAYFQRQGQSDHRANDPDAFLLAQALVYFDVLATEGGRPTWCSQDTPDDGRLISAIICAWDIAERDFAAAKKGSPQTGAPSSAGS